MVWRPSSEYDPIGDWGHGPFCSDRGTIYSRALGYLLKGSWFTRKGKPLMMIYQEKIVQPGSLPAPVEPADALHLQRTIDSLEQENAWLREQLRRVTRDKWGRLSWLPRRKCQSKRPQPEVARAILGRTTRVRRRATFEFNRAHKARRPMVSFAHYRVASPACSDANVASKHGPMIRTSAASVGVLCCPSSAAFVTRWANPLRFMFRKLSDIGQHSGTLCALQTATGGLRCPGLKQRPQALFGSGALWRLACPNFRLSQRPLSLFGLGIVTGQRGPVVPP
jgi:hypothetical protein